MSDSPPLNIKWIIIGAAVICGLNQLLSIGLVNTLYLPLVDSMGGTPARVIYLSTVLLGSFFVGGLLVGWMSPGETLTEPAIASVIAVVANPLLRLAFYGESGLDLGGLIGLAIASGLGFGLGLLGAKVGERIQGDTTDKMRERGELPPL